MGLGRVYTISSNDTFQLTGFEILCASDSGCALAIRHVAVRPHKDLATLWN